MVKLTMTNAAARFECLQGDCPDTCCNGFRVGLTQAEHDRLAVRLASHPATRNRNALVQLNRPHSLNPSAPGADASFAQDDGRCVLLDDDGLCAVHRHFGEEELATVCALYPRTVVEVAGQHSVFLTLACPEAARLILLEEGAFDDATEQLAEAALPEHRRTAHRRLSEQANTPLRPYHVAIEKTALGLEEVAESLHEAMFFIAVFADALHEAQARDSVDIEQTLHQFDAEQQKTISALRQTLATLERSPKEAAKVAQAFAADLVAARLGQQPHARFSKAAQETLFSAPVTTADIQAWFHARPKVARSPQAIDARIASWRQLSARLLPDEKPMRAMLRHALRTEWWIRGTSTVHVAAILMTRVHLVTLLAAFDPRHDDNCSQEVAGEILVNAVQLVAKNMFHVPTFARLMELALEERGLLDLAQMLQLLPPTPLGVDASVG